MTDFPNPHPENEIISMISPSGEIVHVDRKNAGDLRLHHGYKEHFGIVKPGAKPDKEV